MSTTVPARAAATPVNVERWGWYSIGVNVALIVINWRVARASGSLAVGAELIHNAVDLLTAIAVLGRLKLATRKTAQFPYGLYKVENIIAVGLAGMTFFTAYEIAREALFAAASPPTVTFWALAGVVLAWIIPLLFSVFELRAGRAANSPALIADAVEYRAHVFTTGVVFAGMVGQWVNLPLDRIAALLIVVAIVKTGWELLSDGMRVLLDASLDAETLVRVRELIAADPAVTTLRWVTGHNAGRFRFLEAEVGLRVRDLTQAESAVQRISAAIRAAVPHIERVLLHATPQERTHVRLAIPLATPEGALSPHFGEAPYFALATVRLADGCVTEQTLLVNPHQADEKAKGIHVAEWLVAQKADMVLLREDLSGKGPVYVFGEAGIEMQHTEADTLAEALTVILRDWNVFSLPGSGLGCSSPLRRCGIWSVEKKNSR
ncbi:MAG TPA: cation diffusion facilitator family transporter [Anaerolineae bacterium]|nr:cation diffusion facilitator family transporter [Anaerolineae bacterium]HQH39378.1 cation diffusion facilitator family transporter [Anaerolineae bacterium]